jgi:tetratricopeptide (TPR) repeat protein
MLPSLRKNLIVLGLAVLSQAAFADEYSDVSALLRAGKAAEAITKADQYLASKPKDPQMRFFKGVALAEMGRSNDAVSTFVKLTDDYPELPEPYNNLAVIYASQGQYDKARAALEMAIRTNPSYATAHENLGDIYARLASQAYSKALQLDSSNSAIQPKLSLIRDIFTPRGKAGIAVAAAPAPVAVKPTPSPAPIAAAPATPVAPVAAPVPTPKPSSATSATSGTPDKEVEAAIVAWAKAWSSKNMESYFSSYGSDFDNGGKASRKEWETERSARITSKSNITVRISNLSVTVKGNRATAVFRQDYNADKLAVSSRKTLQLVQSGGRWVIVSESSK